LEKSRITELKRARIREKKRKMGRLAQTVAVVTCLAILGGCSILLRQPAQPKFPNYPKNDLERMARAVGVCVCLCIQRHTKPRTLHPTPAAYPNGVCLCARMRGRVDISACTHLRMHDACCSCAVRVTFAGGERASMLLTQNNMGFSPSSEGGAGEDGREGGYSSTHARDVCVCVCVCVCAYVHTHTHTHTYDTSIHLSIHTRVSWCVSVCVCVYLSIYLSIYLYKHRGSPWDLEIESASQLLTSSSSSGAGGKSAQGGGEREGMGGGRGVGGGGGGRGGAQLGIAGMGRGVVKGGEALVKVYGYQGCIHEHTLSHSRTHGYIHTHTLTLSLSHTHTHGKKRRCRRAGPGESGRGKYPGETTEAKLSGAGLVRV